MPRGRGSTGQDVEETRRRLIQAAEECFAAYGPARTTMNDVARRARASRPTLYRYFGDRDTLVAAVIEHRMRRFVELTGEHIDRFPDFPDKVVEGLVHIVAAGREDPVLGYLVRPESLGLATDALTGSRATELSARLWGPLLRQAQRDGRMRPDLDPVEISTWFRDLELMLIGRPDLADAGDPGYRATIRRFVLPALLPDAG